MSAEFSTVKMTCPECAGTGCVPLGPGDSLGNLGSCPICDRAGFVVEDLDASAITFLGSARDVHHLQAKFSDWAHELRHQADSLRALGKYALADCLEQQRAGVLVARAALGLILGRVRSVSYVKLGRTK